MKQALARPILRQQQPARPSRESLRKDSAAESEADRIADRVADSNAFAEPADAPGATPASRSADFAAQFPGAGVPLPIATRGYFEPRLGRDLADVRIHTGSEAARVADRLGAHAFTGGRDIAFGPGEFAPHSREGRHLLAHELAHVIHDGASGALHFKAKAIRFQDEPTLDDVSDGKKILKQGDSGEAVIRITQALSELGYYKNSIIDQRYDLLVFYAVCSLQSAKGLKGVAPEGQVDKQTFDVLDKEFDAGYNVERTLLAKQKSGSLLDGTDSLNAVERTATQRAISTEVKAGRSGSLPTFQREIPGKGRYEDRLSDLVELIIKLEYATMGKGKAADHADPAKLYDWAQIGVIAGAAQAQVDAVFKQYYGGVVFPALTKGTNIFDAWDDKVAMLATLGKPAEDASANWRVEKIITGDDTVMALDAEHGAVQTRGPEAAIIRRVQRKLASKYRKELIETHKGWPGYADDGKIYVQRFKGATQDRQRRDMWEYFQTFIHEYIHTIEGSGHATYRKTMTETKGDKTLREGVTDYLTKVVWNGVTIDDALRKKIEGPFYDPLNPIAIPPLGTYIEAENAERLAGIVGIRNLLAAFFLGTVDLIGKP